MLGNDAKPKSDAQFGLGSAMLLVGIGVFSSIVGSLSSVLTSLDAMNNARGEQLNSINGYLSFRKVDRDLRLKIRGYYNYLWRSGQSRHQRNLFEELPAQLKLELSVTLKEQMLLGVSLFRDLQPATLVAVIKELVPHLILPDYCLIRQGETGEHMYLLYRGKLGVYVTSSGIDTQVALLRNGACFGELALYGDSTRKATVKSLEYCEVESLSFRAVKGLEVFYPDLRTKISAFAKLRFANNYRNIKQQQQQQKLKQAAKSRSTFFGSVSPKRDKSKKTERRLKRQYSQKTAGLVADLYQAARQDVSGVGTPHSPLHFTRGAPEALTIKTNSREIMGMSCDNITDNPNVRRSSLDPIEDGVIEPASPYLERAISLKKVTRSVSSKVVPTEGENGSNRTPQ